MKRALFLLGAYYPIPKANGICAEKVIAQMRARGYQVDVIAFAPNWPCAPDAEWNGVRITYIRGSMYYRTLRSEESGVLKGLQLKMKKAISKAKDIILWPFWPANTPWCTRQFLNKAEQMHNIAPYDVIVGVVSPISAVSAAARFKKMHPEVKMIAYFLDAVSGGVTPKVLPRVLGVRMGLRWEKKVLRCADSIVVMRSHEKHHQKYTTQFQYYERILFLDIPLLCSREIWMINTAKQDESLHIVYVGAINAAVKDPTYILRIASEMPQTVVFDFYGAVNDVELFAPYRNQPNIRLHGEVPHEKAMQAQYMADFLLNIGSSNPCMIPCKIFEYMSTGKPIISTRPIEDEPSLPYLSRYGGCLVLDEREKDIAVNVEALKRFLTQYKGWKADMNAVQREFKENTPTAFVDNVDRLLRKKGEI